MSFFGFIFDLVCKIRSLLENNNVELEDKSFGWIIKVMFIDF